MIKYSDQLVGMIIPASHKITNTKILKPFHLLFLFLCIKGTIMAQTAPDAGLWTTATFECSLNSKFGFFVTEEMRLKENFSRLNLFYTNVGLEYKINKNLKTSLAYRTTQKFLPDNLFSFRHRLQWDVVTKTSPGNFELSYRHRLQTDVRNFYSSDKGSVPEWYSRSKFQVKYNISKQWAPYFSVELRYQIFDPRDPESDQVWHRIRYQGGIDFKLNSRNYLGVYYLIQNEFDIIDPERIYIVGLEYTFKL